MLTSSIKFIEFKIKKKNKIIKKQLKVLLKENNQIIRSLTNKYNNSFNSKSLLKFKKIKNYRIIGMGGSTLGSQAIYDFLKHKIKKKFYFLDNLNSNCKKFPDSDNLNIIISKSGNTLETIVNSNIYIKKKTQ